MFGKRLLPVIALLAFIVSMPLTSAAADQNDPRLDELFARLAVTKDGSEAHAIEAVIWNIWSKADTAGARVLLSQGTADMAAGRHEAALASFDAVVDLEPDFAEGWNKRATVRYLMDDFAGSVADIKRTVALEERHFGALSGLGLIYDQLDQKEAAIKAFRAALEIHPHLDGIRDRMEQLTKDVEGRKL